VPEPLVIRTVGGPSPGDRITDIDQSGWPLPGMLSGAGGVYFKVAESDAPPQEEGSRLMRSALYHWMSDKEIAVERNRTECRV
jgi:hypothetical protein